MSTLALEEFTALRDGMTAGVIIYCLATFACGLLLAWLGAAIGTRLAKAQATDVSGKDGKEATR